LGPSKESEWGVHRIPHGEVNQWGGGLTKEVPKSPGKKKVTSFNSGRDAGGEKEKEERRDASSTKKNN